MIKEAVQYLIDKATGESLSAKTADVLLEGNGEKLQFQHGRHKYLFDPVSGEFSKPIDTQTRDKRHRFGTIASMVDYLKDLDFGDKSIPSIFVDSSGVRAILDENSTDRDEVLRVPFFDADLPTERAMNMESFLLYLDQQSGKITAEDTLRLALKELRIINGSECIAKDQGTHIALEVTKTNDVQAGKKVSIPKYVEIDLRIGTREYSEKHKFRLHIGTDDGLTFKLSRINRDGALERFMCRAIADLRKQLGKGWRVYEGPASTR